VSEILDISKELLGLGATLAKARHERRVALADYLANIATCIEKILEASNVPGDETHHQLCSELFVYASGSENLFYQMLEERKAKEVSDGIRRALLGRQMVYDLSYRPSHDRGKYIRELRKSAGYLRGTANILRAPVPVFERVAEGRSFRKQLSRFWRMLVGGL